MNTCVTNWKTSVFCWLTWCRKTQANSLLRQVMGRSDALRNPAQDHIRHCATSVTRVMYGDQVHEATEPTRNSNRQDT